MKLIDKDALVAEIKRYKHKANERLKIKGRTLTEDCKDSALQNLCGNLLHFLDTLEVKEVDLDAEVEDYIENTSFVTYDLEDCDIKMTAKHFYELGIAVSNKVQKGEE